MRPRYNIRQGRTLSAATRRTFHANEVSVGCRSAKKVTQDNRIQHPDRRKYRSMPLGARTRIAEV
jgi:hypothetical protein